MDKKSVNVYSASIDLSMVMAKKYFTKVDSFPILKLLFCFAEPPKNRYVRRQSGKFSINFFF